MVKITSELSKTKFKNIRFFLNYPRVEICGKDTAEKIFADYVNGVIENDVSIFQEIVEASFEDLSEHTAVNAISEFQVALNKNGLLSIPMEFSQIIGINDISHINGYNYDFNLRKLITLDMLFLEGVDYEAIIQNYIIEEIYSILEEYNAYSWESVYDLMAESIYICEDPVFYFNERELVICISSFELTSMVCNLIEFPINFSRLKGILSDYAIVNIAG